MLGRTLNPAIPHPSLARRMGHQRRE